MRYVVKRHPKVRDDLEGIALLIGDYAGWSVARAKLRTIEERMRLLTSRPAIGSIRDDIHPHLRAIPVADKGVICFTIEPVTNVVTIVLVSYAGADWMSRVGIRL